MQLRWINVRRAGPRWLDDLRARGAAKFAALGIPTVRDEEWRFTNVAPLGAIDFQPAGQISGTAERLNGFAYTDAPLRLVVVNGRFDTRCRASRGCPSACTPGRSRRAEGSRRRRAALLRPARRSERAQLHRAEHRVRAGRRLHPRPGGGVVETPIHVVFVTGGEAGT